MTKILILGGTAEAGELAARLAGDDRLETVTSLAGLTRLPTTVTGSSRRGGFGGPDGLARFLTEGQYTAVIDATHPFAAQIAQHAVEASIIARLPRIKLVRPAFERLPGDVILDVASMAEAADRIPSGSRVFLAAGRREIAAFEKRTDIWCLIRMIEPPTAADHLPDGEVVLGRPSDDPEDEVALMRQHRIDWIVSKDSGGRAGAKIIAARKLGLPIIMIARPDLPDGDIADSVDGVGQWLEKTLFPWRQDQS